MNPLMSSILNRRSVRSYTSEEVSQEVIKQILTAANWAPSGNNIQPWKFAVVMNNKELLKKVASLTIYHKWLEKAPCLIAVFLDTKSLDDKLTSVHLKHTQAIGSAIQNMLLTAHDLGLGTCWIGEILKNEDKVRELLKVSDELQLMAVISVGYSSGGDLKSKRKDISEHIVSWL